LGNKYVYSFGSGKSEGDASMKELLGGKGANLAEMSNIGVNVPGGFTISTEACKKFNEESKTKVFSLIKPEVVAALAKLEKSSGKTFGKGPNPLLVSVRSGAAMSMPGMMDTVLNLGLNEKTITAMIKLTGNECFVYDSYRRFIQMFGNVVMGIDGEKFEAELDAVKKKYKKKTDTDLDSDNLQEVIKRFKAVYKKASKENFPENPEKQLWAAIDAVFSSWNNPRALKYRTLNEITGLLGTAVNVQAMVFGNSGNNSATGVAFSRDPSTGANRYFYGEYLINAQGEDVVAGIRTPQQISKLGSKEWAKSEGISDAVRKKDFPSLEESMPAIYKELDAIKKKLENHYKDMQDMEFTIENGELFMLQTRSGKRTGAAHVKIAMDMLKERKINRETAVLRVPADALDQLLHPIFDAKSLKSAKSLAKGLPASPGAASGIIVFTADEAEEIVAKDPNAKVILVRIETSPEDVGGMSVAVGVLTQRGGMTSHAAVVARGMGTCCVAGCEALDINYKAKKMVVKGVTLKQGDVISLNGSTGLIYKGDLPTEIPKLTKEFKDLMALSDKFRKLKVRTNAETPADTAIAVGYGAEGIGLCRTEHMFFEGEKRRTAFRRLILVAEEVKNLKSEIAVASDDEAKTLAAKLVAPEKQYLKALKDLLPLQRKDFMGIFKNLKGRECTIRLLDPPLHEFLPHDAKGQKQMATEIGVSPAAIKKIVDSLEEQNPMLGHRGCRLGISYPEVTEMQTQAIVEAAIAVKGSKPEIMVPLVGHVKELSLQKELIQATINKVKKAKNIKSLKIPIGTMIEVPRAAVTADMIAAEADFFSFGTNDLTQMGCGFSRDDAGKFLGEYVEKGVYESDPFQVLDQDGVGRLIEIAVEKGRSTKKKLKIGICGEHGGEPSSIDFCHRTGLDYVSCSPFRVPIARLAAAQAAINNK